MNQRLQRTSQRLWLAVAALASLAVIVAFLGGLWPLDRRTVEKGAPGRNQASGSASKLGQGQALSVRPESGSGAGDSAGSSESVLVALEQETGDIAHIEGLLDSLLQVEPTGFFFHDVVEQHLGKVLEVMAFLQKNPGAGFAVVERFYGQASNPLHKGLLVFIASAARDIEEAQRFFRTVMADHGIGPSVRLACAYALGMANLPIEDFTTPPRITWEIPEGPGLAVPKPCYDSATLVRGHYATVLWAMGNMLTTRHQALVEIMSIGCRRPWPEDMMYGWRGTETRSAVLRILVDALETETCLRTRYILLASIHCLEDTQLLVDTYKRAYGTDTWTIPERYHAAGSMPAHNYIVFRVTKEAVATQNPAWLEALRWVQEREKPWETQNYARYVIEAWQKLGWVDRPFVEWVLTPYLRPEICQGGFPNEGDAGMVLKDARALIGDEEAAGLFLQVARTASANATKQIQVGQEMATYLLVDCRGLPNENQILSILLAHPNHETRSATATAIGKRGITQLVDELTRAYSIEPEQTVCAKIYEAVKVLAPDTAASLPQRRFQTQQEQLAELLRSGTIDQETYESLLDFYKEGGDAQEEAE